MKATLQGKPEATELHELCDVCQRVRWGNYQYLTKGHWRHEECAPGSKNWCEYYAALPRSKRDADRDALLRWATNSTEVA